MGTKDVLRTLAALGTAQNRKTYRRHGVGNKQYGVSYANLRHLGKSIKIDHSLAVSLWGTGNHDARVLATIVADPEVIKSSRLDTWVRDLDNYVIADAFTDLVAKTPFAISKMQKWSKARGEWVGRAGWLLLARIALSNGGLPDRCFETQLKTIEEEIHGRKNRVRDAMNSAVIAIGLRNAKLERKALTAAKRIGTIDVDHGDTSCKTPDAAQYIKKTVTRRRGKRT